MIRQNGHSLSVFTTAMVTTSCPSVWKGDLAGGVETLDQYAKNPAHPAEMIQDALVERINCLYNLHKPDELDQAVSEFSQSYPQNPHMVQLEYLQSLVPNAAGDPGK